MGYKNLLLVSLMFSYAVHAQEIMEEKTFWQKFRTYSDVAMTVIVGRMDSLGISLRAMLKPSLPDWHNVSLAIGEDMMFGSCRETDCDGTYHNDLGLVAGARIGYSEKFEFLNNTESFDLRRSLIKNAKKSIYVAVWGIYNDETGWEFQKLILDALTANPKLDVRIIIDGNMTKLNGHEIVADKLERLSNGKVKIVRWKSWKYRANGNHRKMFIVDNEHTIVGGLNIGNHYSHLKINNPADAWRDFDIHIKGQSAGMASHNQFAEIWNKQLEENPFYLNSPYNFDEMVELESLTQGEGMPVLFVDQHPGSASKEAKYSIHSAITKLFRNAVKSIDIENAYFILDPHIKEELKKAIQRGIRVRIFTNSTKSVDEPIIALPIMESAKFAAKTGALVYLQNGPTMHSKYMVVDDKISVTGSFNFHPQSLRIYGENVAIAFDKDTAMKLKEKFELGIQKADLILDPDKMNLPFNSISTLMKILCFDCL